jgi:hypothetical protein
MGYELYFIKAVKIYSELISVWLVTYVYYRMR